MEETIFESTNSGLGIAKSEESLSEINASWNTQEQQEMKSFAKERLLQGMLYSMLRKFISLSFLFPFFSPPLPLNSTPGGTIMETR